MQTDPIPYGYCHCGCGHRTAIPDKTDRSINRFAGRPNRFVKGHCPRSPMLLAEHHKRWEDAGVPYGECLCGCGERTIVAKATDRAGGRVRGEPVKYIHGHSWRKSPVEYIERDCGYTTPCWVWQRACRDDGYGSAWRDGHGISAHKLIWERHYGSVPDGLELDHLCRNPSCVNPAHLEPVTHAENVRRGAKPKLSLEVARVIRERYAAGGISQQALADEYGVWQTTISVIVRNLAWRL